MVIPLTSFHPYVASETVSEPPALPPSLIQREATMDTKGWSRKTNWVMEKQVAGPTVMFNLGADDGGG
ncbi:hypothetical protein L1987_03237 [Smallanthus sonchifolius]|uniref:Uncharacterized protein n=1 Tax=Smallanthus sonchifolius TaxID=185202 RepID=A0ACB9KA47_9ASTR|nr:hypothetical protein L1987_03237 [Smallanthus sonchifolius]